MLQEDTMAGWGRGDLCRALDGDRAAGRNTHRSFALEPHNTYIAMVFMLMGQL